MTRLKDEPGMYSATGVVGDATVATREKGRVLVEALVAGALDDIEKIRAAPLPAAKKTAPPPAAPASRAVAWPLAGRHRSAPSTAARRSRIGRFA